jgi:hypothetical protein
MLCIWDAIPLFSRVPVPFDAADWKSVSPGCLGAGLLFGAFWLGFGGHLFLFCICCGSLVPKLFGCLVGVLDRRIGDPYFLAGLCWGECSPALAFCVC